MQSDVDSTIRVEDSPIMMTATVNNNDVNYDLTQDDEWECDNAGSCTRSFPVAIRNENIFILFLYTGRAALHLFEWIKEH